MKKCVLWGIGNNYNRHVNLLRCYEANEWLKVVALTDKRDFGSFLSIDGYPVVNAMDVKNVEFDYLIVMTDKHFVEIVEDAVELGVAREKIISCRVLEIPMLDFEKYVTLKESSVSIISNNCWGGGLYTIR